MPISLHTLIWLFPVAFIVHDMEELVLLGPWLRKNADDIKGRVPAMFVPHMDAMTRRSTGALATAIFLTFGLTVLSAFLAVEHRSYGFVIFLVASAMFFVHGLGHLGQAILLRRFVPGFTTSIVVVIPYGAALFARLIDHGIVGWAGLIVSCVLGATLFMPFLLAILKLGDFLYARASRLLIP